MARRTSTSDETETAETREETEAEAVEAVNWWLTTDLVAAAGEGMGAEEGKDIPT